MNYQRVQGAQVLPWVIVLALNGNSKRFFKIDNRVQEELWDKDHFPSVLCALPRARAPFKLSPRRSKAGGGQDFVEEISRGYEDQVSGWFRH